MQKIFLCIILFFYLLASAQRTIVYNLQFNMPELNRLMPADTTESDSAFVIPLKQLLLSKMKPEQMTYTIHDTVITMKRSNMPEASYVYSPNNLKYLVQETAADGTTSISTMDMDYKRNPGWKVRYDVQKFTGEKKTIEGFSCYKILLVENKTIDGQTNVRRMEMWVTDQIQLPAFIVAGLYDTVVFECPLEIRVWNQGAMEPLGTSIVASIE